jgi:hypothetical protein
MQVRLTKAHPHLFNKFADRSTLFFAESSQLLEQFRINLNL